MALTPKLLDFASRLRALAVDGVFVAQGSARELAASLGVPERTMRERIKALEAQGAIVRGNDRGGRVSLDFRRPEERQENGKNGKNGNCRPDENGKNGNGGGKGEAERISSQQKQATREAAAAAAGGDETRTARTASENGKNGKSRTARLAKGHVRITLEGPPEDLAPIVEALRGVAPRVSHGKAEASSTATSSPRTSSHADLEFDDATPEEAELIEERFAQMKDDGEPVKKRQIMGAIVLKDIRTTPAIKAGLASSLAERRAKAQAAKDEKERAQKNSEARAQEARQVLQQDETPAQAKERLARIERERAERARNKILENSAARRGVAT